MYNIYRGSGCRSRRGVTLETVGGYTLCPQLGVRRMDYVSLNNMLTYTLVLIALAELIVVIYANKKK